MVVGPPGANPNFNGSVAQIAVAFTSTSTTFGMQAGPMDVNVTFLSPIEACSPLFLKKAVPEMAWTPARRPRSTVVPVLIYVYRRGK